MAIDYSKQIGKKITTKGSQKTCIHTESIVYIQCEGNFVTLFINDNNKVQEIKTLKKYEEDLSGIGFIRISKNTIINGKYVTKISTSIDKRIVYLGEIALKISKRRLSYLKKQLC